MLLLIVILLLAGYNYGQVTVVNMTPITQSDEDDQNSEPNIAVNPADPLEIAASAFTPTGTGANAPIYVSNDGGLTWVLNHIVPSQAGSSSGTGDITLRFATSSSILYSGILRVPGNFRLNILRTTNFTSPTPMTVLVDRNDVDQPYIQAATVLGGAGRGNDRVYVGDNDLNAALDRTATIDLSLNASVTTPVFNTHRIETRSPHLQDGPQIRPAIHLNGTVYAIFYHWTNVVGTPSLATITADVVVVRDDNWGSGGTPFGNLLDPGDSNAGIRVVQGRTIPWENPGLGQERIGGTNAIAVDPRDSDTVYIAWADRVGTTDYTLHVRHSTDGGVNWDAADIRTITNALNPGLAINSRGTVGFLYQQLTGAGGSQRWVTHFERTDNNFATINNLTLATVPANTPTRQFFPYLGDYAGAMAVGKNFYGVFSANNTPDNANFPNAVTYLRNANFATHTLLQTDNVTPVAVSIDPFFFMVTELAADADFYVSDWTDSATSYDMGLEPSTHANFFSYSDVWNRRSNSPGGFNANNQPQSRDPWMATSGYNYAFARIRRNTSGTAETVTAHFLVSEFGTGSNYAHAGTAPDPTISFSATDVEKTMSSGYQWQLPVTTSTHTCLAVEISTASDPIVLPSVWNHAPGWPDTDLMFINDNNKAQRNMGVYSFSSSIPDLGPLSYYAIVHNAATFPRDMIIRCTAAPEVQEKLGTLKLRGIGGESKTTDNGIVFPNMQPGENRWIELSLDVPRGSKGEILPVFFYEMVGKNAVNGFAIAVKHTDMSKVIRENLEFHKNVLFRISAVYGKQQAQLEGARASNLCKKDKIAGNNYLEFLKMHTSPSLYKAEVLTFFPKKVEPFGVSAAVGRFLRDLRTGDLRRLVIAHANLLHKLDAFITMQQKTKGDTADILQNVQWQKALFSKVPLLKRLVVHKPILEKSNKFIDVYSRGKIGINAYPEFIGSIMAEFRYTAKALHNKIRLMDNVLEMESSIKDPTALQKAHRQFLLKLQSLK